MGHRIDDTKLGNGSPEDGFQSVRYASSSVSNGISIEHEAYRGVWLELETFTQIAEHLVKVGAITINV